MIVGSASLALLIAAAIRAFLFQPFSIPSSALAPTVLAGDYVFVSKFPYGYSRFSLPPGEASFKGRTAGAPPQRGDVVVFKLPKDERTDYIKRIIGLPGDKIQLIDARLYINGEEVAREPMSDYRTTDAEGRATAVPHYLETLPNGVSHEIIQKDGDTGYWSNTDVYSVPPDCYFMMGDNRDNSQDSRVLSEVGYVPLDNIEGRAEIIYFSVDPDRGLPRFDRFFQRVR